MSTTWNTKYGPRRVRHDPPTLEEAIFAARGLTDDVEQQIDIAAGLMEVSADEVRAALKKSPRAAQAGGDRRLHQPRRDGAFGRGGTQDAAPHDCARRQAVRSAEASGEQRRRAVGWRLVGAADESQHARHPPALRRDRR